MININSESEPAELNGQSRDIDSRMNAGFILLDKHIFWSWMMLNENDGGSLI